ncbi:hypothetical protein HWN40_13220 [Methanolobus zinderi]|uniref:Uncharacterized protein n=1 Tax=Methanolobus zinderi TaxID=536044 RepID=A0A7D5JA97_9EURY|nr:hypothetical protein [Methanolobus zinderi]QLC51110.1 hypothetical protein HWN40_13220 [Methanolobus zinderi]
MGDFVIVMQFIAGMVAEWFSILAQVDFGEFSLLTVFISLLLLRLVIWFICRLFGVELEKDLERTADGLRTFSAGMYQKGRSRYHLKQAKNRVSLYKRYGSTIDNRKRKSKERSR